MIDEFASDLPHSRLSSTFQTQKGFTCRDLEFTMRMGTIGKECKSYVSIFVDHVHLSLPSGPYFEKSENSLDPDSTLS